MGNKIYLVMIVAMIIAGVYFVTIPTDDDRNEVNKVFQEIVNQEIKELSIVEAHHGNYSFLTIKNKGVIKEFMNALKQDTYMPKYATGQYNYSYAITLHSKNNNYLLILQNETFHPDIRSDSVEITVYDVKNVNLYDIYRQSRLNDSDFFSIFTELYGYGKYMLRNHQLYNVINKHIKNKGK